METPDLTDRFARCHVGGPAVPSSFDLAFFEFRGEDSESALMHCTCGYTLPAHEAINPFTKRPGITDHPFTARGASEYDNYYCGCRGWD